MTQSRLINEYFEWMCDLVHGDAYYKLLSQLYDIDFTYIIPLDGNRADDGIDLRYRFGYERNHADAMIATYLDVRPCSVLEMMIALAIRCEDHIMDDPDLGNRTDQWFWNMIESLGLSDMDNNHYDEDRVSEIIDIFLNRDYERDGRGGLFTVVDCERDLRSVEIWYQLHRYLRDIL